MNEIKYSSLADIKEAIKKDINGISVFSKGIKSTIPFSLNDIYNLYNYSQKFDNLIKQFQSVDWEKIDTESAEKIIKSLSFIFDITKKSNPISYAVFYSMQYTFWQVVVVGGFLANKKLSAKLLSNSLTTFGKKAEDLTIEDKITDELLIKSTAFNGKIKELIQKYGKEKETFDLKDYEENGVSIKFEGGDLLYSLHKATMYMKATKNKDNTWKLEGEIIDTYDFTEFKNLEEYIDNKEAIFSDIFSTLLNNFGVVSSEYGVIKTYDVKIKFNFDNYKI